MSISLKKCEYECGLKNTYIVVVVVFEYSFLSLKETEKPVSSCSESYTVHIHQTVLGKLKKDRDFTHRAVSNKSKSKN